MVMGDEKRRMRFERVLLKGEEVEERRRERAKERKVTRWKRKGRCCVEEKAEMKGELMKANN